MVSLSFLIALVALIDVTRSFEYFIDMKRCKTGEMTCFVRDSCVVDSETADPNNLVKLEKKDTLNGDTCDVIVQLKAFTQRRLHVLMQVTADSGDELDTNIGVSLNQHKPQIKCSSSGAEGSDILTVVAYGTQRLSDKNSIFCSVIIKSITTGEDINVKFGTVPYKDSNPSIQFSTKNTPDQSVVYDSSGPSFWINSISKVACDDEKISTGDTIDNDVLLFEIDKAPAELKCPKYPHLDVPLLIRVEHDAKVTWPDSLTCKDKKWIYEKDGSPITVLPTSSLTVHCAVKFSAICPKLSIKTCPGCDIGDPTYNGGTATCPQNTWRLDDGSLKDTSLTCKQIGSERKSGWFMQYDEKEVTEGACSKDYHCPTFSKLDFSITDKSPATDYQEVEKSDPLFEKDLSCSPGYDLTVSNSGNTKNVSTLSCDLRSGLYKIGGTLDTVARESSVFCRKPRIPEKNAEEERIASANMSKWAGIGVGSLLGLAALGGIIFFFVKRHIRYKRLMKLKYPDGMMTAREIHEDREFVNEKNGKYYIQQMTESMRQSVAKKAQDMPKFSAYNVVDPITDLTSEITPRENEFTYWRLQSFNRDILPQFHRFSAENKLKCLRSMTAFMHYSDTHKARECEQFGMMDQFFWTVRRCHQRKMKCYETWDSMFRLLKIFCERLPKESIHEVPYRLRCMMKKIASDILWDVGYRQKPDESDHAIGLRLVAARILLWMKDEKCMEELSKMAKLPLHEIESPMRMVVFSHAVNNIPGKEQVIKGAFYANIKVLNDREPPKGVKFGTFRQHLIYALCSAKDTSDGSGLMGSFATMREMFEILYENDRSVFTPTDLLYAYMGALEDYGSMITAVDQFMMFNPRKCEGEKAQEIVDEMFKKHRLCIAQRAFDDEEKKVMAARHKVDMLATATLLAENCFNDNQFKALQPHWHFMVNYAIKPDSEVFTETFDEEKLSERVHNLQFLLAMDMVSFDIAKILSSAGFHTKPES